MPNEVSDQARVSPLIKCLTFHHISAGCRACYTDVVSNKLFIVSHLRPENIFEPETTKMKKNRTKNAGYCCIGLVIRL